MKRLIIGALIGASVLPAVFLIAGVISLLFDPVRVRQRLRVREFGSRHDLHGRLLCEDDGMMPVVERSQGCYSPALANPDIRRDHRAWRLHILLGEDSLPPLVERLTKSANPYRLRGDTIGTATMPPRGFERLLGNHRGQEAVEGVPDLYGGQSRTRQGAKPWTSATNWHFCDDGLCEDNQ